LRRAPEAQAVSRSREAPPRVPRHPRAEGTGRLVHVQYPVHARRRSPGPKDIRQGRAVPAPRLRRDEAARGRDSRKKQGPSDRSAGAPGAALRCLEQAGRGGQVAREAGSAAGSAKEVRGKNRPLKSEVIARYFFWKVPRGCKGQECGPCVLTARQKSVSPICGTDFKCILIGAA